jgi:hypothetical protein
MAFLCTLSFDGYDGFIEKLVWDESRFFRYISQYKNYRTQWEHCTSLQIR